jgi:micrococcal nuclease
MFLLNKLLHNTIVNSIRFPTLMRCGLNNTPVYGYSNIDTFGKILRVYDGDTLWIAVKLPDNKNYYQLNCRMYGYDAPEMKPSKTLPNREEHIKKAITAKIELSNYVNSLVKVHIHKFDKYGRFLVTIWKPSEEKSINQQMVEKGFGYAYFGGTKKTEEQINQINQDNKNEDIHISENINENNEDIKSNSSNTSNTSNTSNDIINNTSIV